MINYISNISLTLKIESNAGRPLRINRVRVVGAAKTRRSFLDKIVFQPLQAISLEPQLTLASALEAIQNSCTRLYSFGIFQDVKVLFDQASLEGATPDDIDVTINVKERPRLSAQTGTDFGNAEAGAYGNITLRNVFGGAENLVASISTGTKTRTAIEACLEGPLNASIDKRWSISCYNVARNNMSYASHTEILRGFTGKISSVTRFGMHDISGSAIWRQLTGLPMDASPSLRVAAGDSVKISVAQSLTFDTRDSTSIPSSGMLFRVMQEIAGGPLGGDTSFIKASFDAQHAFSLSEDRKYVGALTLRGGMLWPFDTTGSKLPDRFYLGGPTDLRGFQYRSIGPRDEKDFLGGETMLAATINILTPLPSANPSWPLKLQTFLTAGSLLPLNKGIVSEPIISILTVLCPN